MQRLDQILRGAGLANKREVPGLIAAGRVLVDGALAESGAQLCEAETQVLLDGAPVPQEQPVCLMLYKPAGYVTATVSDREPAVTALLPPEYRCFFPVGRLDLDSEGLLLLTNDGPLCHRIIMPGSGVVKTYFITVRGDFRPDTEARFREGIAVDNHLVCLPADIRISGRSALVFVQEGKRHQVKRMAAAAGARVTYLKRLAIGGLRLDETLEKGAFRALSPEEIASIFGAPASFPNFSAENTVESSDRSCYTEDSESRI